MSIYLARLKVIDVQKPTPAHPSKGSKAPFEPFEGDQGRCFSESTRPAPARKKSTEAFEPSECERGGGFSENEAPNGPPAPAAEQWQARAAILERAGIPSEWAELFAKLLCGPPPGDFDQAYWSRVVKGATIFADEWTVAAYRAGWRAEEIFGLDEIKPAARHDRKGLAWFLSDGACVVALDAKGADIVTRQGSRQRFYRSPIKACDE